MAPLRSIAIALAVLATGAAPLDELVPGRSTQERARALLGNPTTEYRDWIEPGTADVFAERPSVEEAMALRAAKAPPREEVWVLEYAMPGRGRAVLAFHGKVLRYALLPPGESARVWSDLRARLGAPSRSRVERPITGDVRTALEVHEYAAQGIGYAVGPDGAVRWRILLPRSGR